MSAPKPDLPTIRVAIADDHILFAQCLERALRDEPTLSITGLANNGDELLTLVRSTHPDVVLSDLQMPVTDGYVAMQQIATEYPGIGLIALTMHCNSAAYCKLNEIGVRGFLDKATDRREVVEAVRRVQAGGRYYCSNLVRQLGACLMQDRNRGAITPRFTDRELQIMQYLYLQFSSKEIAAELGCPTRHIEGARERLQKKINVRNATGIVLYALQHQLLSPADGDNFRPGFPASL